MTQDLFARQVMREAKVKDLAWIKRRVRVGGDAETLARDLHQAKVISSKSAAKRKRIFSRKPNLDSQIREAIGLIEAGDNVEYTLYWPPKEISIDQKLVINGKALGYFQHTSGFVLLVVGEDREVYAIRLNPDGYRGIKIIVDKKINVNPKKGEIKISLKPLGDVITQK